MILEVANNQSTKLSEFFKRNGHCKGTNAQTVAGVDCDYDSPIAENFCIIGAMARIGGGLAYKTYPDYQTIQDICKTEFDSDSISNVNDNLIRDREHLIEFLTKYGQ